MVSTGEAVLSGVAEGSGIRCLPRLRIRMLGFLKGAGLTWVFALVLAFQAHTFDAEKPAPHPLQQLLQAGQVQVDSTVLTVVAELSSPPSYDLGAWKQLLQGVTGVLASGGRDVPETWELTAEVHDGFRTLRYEGRGAHGTHWVVSAYQLGNAETVHVTLRSEVRGLPEDLRRASYTLQTQLKRGLAQPVSLSETRIVVTGRTDARLGYTLAAFGEELLQTLHGTENLRVREVPGAVSVAGQTPYLDRSVQGGTNIELQLMPEGEKTRITVATPQLATVDAVLLTGRAAGHDGYTSLASGQTTLAR